ncbi:unnamed protein product [Rhizophagus irregularis]|nr:unnamed protein product [Rhizophagus irregularis]
MFIVNNISKTQHIKLWEAFLISRYDYNNLSDLLTEDPLVLIEEMRLKHEAEINLQSKQLNLEPELDN